MQKKLIIFDMDGTLVDSSDLLSGSINYVRVNLGMEAMEKEFLLKNLNDPYLNLANFFYGTEDFTQEQFKLFEEYYLDNLTKDLTLYEGIFELICELSQYRELTIATNASEKFAVEVFEHFNIADKFSQIVGITGELKAKPHPDIIHKTIQNSTFSHKESVLVGDSLKDRLAAQNAGIDSILVNWGFTEHKEEFVENVDELKEKLGDL